MYQKIDCLRTRTPIRTGRGSFGFGEELRRRYPLLLSVILGLLVIGAAFCLFGSGPLPAPASDPPPPAIDAIEYEEDKQAPQTPEQEKKASGERPRYSHVVRSPQKEDIIDPAYFDNSVFLGDSLSQGLVMYDLFNDKTKVIAEKGMTAKKAVASLDSIAEESPGRVYILLGVNDLCNYNATVERQADAYRQLLLALKEKMPHCELVVQSVFPVAKKYDNATTKLTNERIDAFNALLFATCEELGLCYADISSSFKDGQGWLLDDMTSDGLHICSSYYAFWLNLLMENTSSQK